jgi:hypothetical protein
MSGNDLQHSLFLSFRVHHLLSSLVRGYLTSQLSSSPHSLLTNIIPDSLSAHEMHYVTSVSRLSPVGSLDIALGRTKQKTPLARVFSFYVRRCLTSPTGGCKIFQIYVARRRLSSLANKCCYSSCPWSTNCTPYPHPVSRLCPVAAPGIASHRKHHFQKLSVEA